MKSNLSVFIEQIGHLLEVASRQNISLRYFGGVGSFANLSEQEQILAVTGLSKYSELLPIFKSVNFWGTSSYPLDVLYSESYDQLFERLPFYQASLNRAAMKIFKGEMQFIENPVPTHVAWEKQGSMSCEISYKFLAAVYNIDGYLVGALCVSQIKPISN